ncbi:hypothetical protein BGZ98_008966, partial [Dissophora globulifera]
GASSVSFVLVGRDKQGLDTVLSELKHSVNTSNNHVAVKGTVVANVDLADISILDDSLARIHAAAAQLRTEAAQSNSTITKTVLFNNAGSLGDLGKTTKEVTWQDARRYFDFNVVSFVGLSSTFLKETQAAFPKDQYPQHQTVIVNISSLLAVQPFSNWGLYATGKAARDRLLGVVALEEKENNVKTLNYAPGPLDNAMQADVRRTLGDKEQLEIYEDMHQKGSLVAMDDSSRKLVLLLEKDEFVSGGHIDFYDE